METPFPAYQGPDPYVFVCYAHDDMDTVYSELAWLRDQGVNVWYDEGISPGSEFPEELGQAILGATLVLYYVSPRSVASRHCRDEVYFALDRSKKVLALHLEPVELPAGLALTTATTQAVMRHSLPVDVYQDKLLEGIRGSADAIQRPPPGPVSGQSTRRWITGSVLAVLVAALGYAGLLYFEKQSDVRWVEREAIPQLQEMVETEWRDFQAAFDIAEQAEKILPDDSRIEKIFEEIALNIDITSDPIGATVSVKPYKQPNAPWRVLGTTPLANVRLPVSVLRWKFEAPGFAAVEAAHSTWNLNPTVAGLIVPNPLHRVLDPIETIPEGMVRVAGTDTADGTVSDFFIDRYEVTNADYQSFVDDGGYSNEHFWEHPFMDGQQEIPFDEAMARFVDQSGRPGPSSWLGGTFESGKENHPVSGVSWYEAAAYAKYRNRHLPSGLHWGLARGETSTLIQFPQLGGHALFTPFSNFHEEGTVPVGSMPGITSYGAYDLAGNVREWCFNPTSSGRLVRGAGYGDNTYKFEELGQAPPLFRVPGYGFRTVHLPDGMRPESVFNVMSITPSQQYRPEDVVSDDVFQIFLRQFDYDKTDPDGRLQSRSDGPFWRSERISVTLPYGNERMDVVLFLPLNAKPPYQTVIYFPGSGSIFHGSSEHLEEYYEFPVFLSFLVKTGRAVVYPIYNGTFERADETTTQLHLGMPTNAYTSYLIELVQDFRRTVDYLETREDVDSERMAYYGMSWGGILGSIMTAADDRIATMMLLSGGLTSDGRPEAHPLHYAPRVDIPVLMMSGRFDSLLGYEISVEPLYELLGTAPEHKILKVYETDHIPPKKEFVTEIQNWLDRYFGPVTPVTPEN